ncbi:hypothetical protein TNCV_3788561 [Trichonephila clavipes]|nr:hypothetical protein TNCV_3788561 [Trichonephila clavipes]
MENHQTRECQIQRTENAFCINCCTRHMANYAKCLICIPNRKVTTSSSKTTTLPLLTALRLNFSYAQATNNNNSNQQQQMAPPVKEPPATKNANSGQSRTHFPQQVNPIKT